MVWFTSQVALAGGWEILDRGSKPGEISFADVTQLTVPLDGSVDLGAFAVVTDGGALPLDALVQKAGVKAAALDLVAAERAVDGCGWVDGVGVCPAPPRIVIGPDTAPFAFDPSGEVGLAFPVDGSVDLSRFSVVTRGGDLSLDPIAAEVGGATSRYAEIDGESTDADHDDWVDVGGSFPKRFCIILFGVRICAPA
ncbi:MAG: hypothetical protein ABMA64_42840 [Myxococcota bacterium]